MADSANILSILSALGGNMEPSQAAAAPVDVPQANVLQGIAQPPPQAPSAPTAEQIYQAATAASPPTPKPRRSLVDIIGHLADGIAAAGGATPMYQRTLDDEQKRITDAQDHGLKVDASTIENATSKFKLGDLQNARRAQFARGLIALRDAGNGNNDVGQALPVLGQQMGFTPQELQAFQQELAVNPHALDAMATSGLDPTKSQDAKYLGITQVIRNKETGAIQVLQPSGDGSPARNLIPDGWEYVDTYKSVDLGGSTGMTGSHSATPQIIIPHTIKPDTVANNAQSDTNNRRTTGAQIEIAGMPARAKDGADGKGSDPNSGLKILADIDESFDNLHRLKALPGDAGTVVGDITGAIGRTALGQKLGATTGLSAAAQERELLGKNLANLQSDLIKSLPGNATRTKFEQEIQKKRLPDPTTMTYAIAKKAVAQIREAYTAALKSQSKATTSAAPASNLPRLSPADAAKLAPGTPFIGLDGVQRVRH